MRQSLAILLGPALGGLLLGLGRVVPFASIGIASLAAAGALTRLRRRTQLPRAEDAPADADGVLRGARWLWSRPFLRSTTLAGAGSNVTWGAIDIVLIVRAHEARAPAFEVGVMVALLGLGSLLGAGLVRPLRARFAEPALVQLIFAFEALMLPCMLLTREPVLLGTLGAVASLGATTWSSVISGARLRSAPDELAGQINGAARLITSTAFPFAVLLVGALMDVAGSTGALVALAAWQTALAVWVTLSSGIRSGAVAPVAAVR